jgi:hypothetical protein
MEQFEISSPALQREAAVSAAADPSADESVDGEAKEELPVLSSDDVDEAERFNELAETVNEKTVALALHLVTIEINAKAIQGMVDSILFSRRNIGIGMGSQGQNTGQFKAFLEAEKQSWLSSDLPAYRALQEKLAEKWQTALAADGDASTVKAELHKVTQYVNLISSAETKRLADVRTAAEDVFSNFAGAWVRRVKRAEDVQELCKLPKNWLHSSASKSVKATGEEACSQLGESLRIIQAASRSVARTTHYGVHPSTDVPIAMLSTWCTREIEIRKKLTEARDNLKNLEELLVEGRKEMSSSE